MIAFLDRIVMWVYYFHQKRSFPEQTDQGFFQLHVKEKSTSWCVCVCESESDSESESAERCAENRLSIGLGWGLETKHCHRQIEGQGLGRRVSAEAQ